MLLFADADLRHDAAPTHTTQNVAQPRLRHAEEAARYSIIYAAATARAQSAICL